MVSRLFPRCPAPIEFAMFVPGTGKTATYEREGGFFAIA